MRQWTVLRICTLLCVLLGCGFEVTPGTAIDPNSDATPSTDDAAIEVDARVVDAMPDARACLADVDNDGICDDDGNDTWLCGATAPAAPMPSVPLNETQGSKERKIALSMVKLGGGPNLRNVARGTTFTLAANYAISDCICDNCIDQIQVGFIDQTTKKCAYSGNPSCPAQTTGDNTLTFTAPNTPGVYSLGYRLGQDFSCEGNSGTNTGWWDATPPAPAQIVAKICVPNAN